MRVSLESLKSQPGMVWDEYEVLLRSQRLILAAYRHWRYEEGNIDDELRDLVLRVVRRLEQRMLALFEWVSQTETKGKELNYDSRTTQATETRRYSPLW